MAESITTQEQMTEQAIERTDSELENATRILFDAHLCSINTETREVFLDANIEAALKISADACRELKRKYDYRKLAQVEELFKKFPQTGKIYAFSVNYGNTLTRNVSCDKTVDEDIIEQCARAAETCLTMRRLQEQLRDYRKLKALDGIL